MNSKGKEELIIRFLTNSASEADLEELNAWLKKPGNEELFKEYITINYALNHNTTTYSQKNKTKLQLLKNIQRDRKFKPVRDLKPFFKYAAVAVLVIGIGYFLGKPIISNDQNLTIPEEVVTLQLDNGNIEILQEGGQTQIMDEEGNIIGYQYGDKLVYTDNKKDNNVISYNSIKVPYGKIFNIQLADGTLVKLNAGSSLKFPTNFKENSNRRVHLNGEAYFSVTNDENRPFIVNAGEVDIQVLGTEFNLTSYLEDNYINTVLIEGSVAMYDHKKSFTPENISLLEPGQKGVWDKTTEKINVSEADISMHTAWLDGKIIFRHVKFEDIVKKLERHYNVTIISNNEKLNEQTYTASFDIETIDQVLNAFNKNFAIKYKISGNKIIIY